MLSEDFGGRVELAKAYYKAITESVQKYFKGNGVIASMEHCNDFMFLGTQAISLGRVGMSHCYYSYFSLQIMHILESNVVHDSVLTHGMPYTFLQ